MVRLILPILLTGPDANHLISFDIFIKVIASVLNEPDNITKRSFDAISENLFPV